MTLVDFLLGVVMVPGPPVICSKTNVVVVGIDRPRNCNVGAQAVVVVDAVTVSVVLAS